MSALGNGDFAQAGIGVEDLAGLVEFAGRSEL
jgi:hypothetical protein